MPGPTEVLHRHKQLGTHVPLRVPALASTRRWWWRLQMAAIAAAEVESKMGTHHVAASVSFVILISVGWGVELLLRSPSGEPPGWSLSELYCSPGIRSLHQKSPQLLTKTFLRCITGKCVAACVLGRTRVRRHIGVGLWLRGCFSVVMTVPPATMGIWSP